jgi:hypothetical protein
LPASPSGKPLPRARGNDYLAACIERIQRTEVIVRTCALDGS